MCTNLIELSLILIGICQWVTSAPIRYLLLGESDPRIEPMGT